MEGGIEWWNGMVEWTGLDWNETKLNKMARLNSDVVSVSDL